MSTLSTGDKIKTRFVPSPTGFLHVGGLRTALYNFLFARQNGGEFLFRIEDTDRARTVEGAEENIIKTLKVFKLDFDNAPFRQSENLARYKECADKLMNNGIAYEDSGAIRFKMPKEGTAHFNDIVHGDIEMENQLQEDFVILKSDGYPTYNLAHLVDDHDMGITHVIRGEEFIPSMPKYIALHNAFGWDLPKYAHLPLLLNQQRAKLSKREGDKSAKSLIEEGYLKEAILNFVALLGWHPKTEQEIFSLQELIGAFHLEDVQKAGAIFDNIKLDWINREHIKRMPLEILYERVKEFAADPINLQSNIGSGNLNKTKVLKILELVRPRLNTFSELPNIFAMFNAKPEYDASLLKWKGMTNDEIKKSLGISKNLLEELTPSSNPPPWGEGRGGGFNNFTKANLEKIFMTYTGNLPAGKAGDRGELLWPLRVALSGKKASPGPFEIMEILGKETCILRLNSAIDKLG